LKEVIVRVKAAVEFDQPAVKKTIAGQVTRVEKEGQGGVENALTSLSGPSARSPFAAAHRK
jgi:hypothetical protein